MSRISDYDDHDIPGDLDPIIGTLPSKDYSSEGQIRLVDTPPSGPTNTFWTRPITYPYRRTFTALAVVQSLWLLCMILFGPFPAGMDTSSGWNTTILFVLYLTALLPLLPLSFTIFFKIPLRLDCLNAVPILLFWTPAMFATEWRALTARPREGSAERALFDGEVALNVMGCILLLTLTLTLVLTAFLNHFAIFNAQHADAPVSLADVWAVGWGARRPGFVWERTTQFRFGMSKWTVRKEVVVESEKLVDV